MNKRMESEKGKKVNENEVCSSRGGDSHVEFLPGKLCLSDGVIEEGASRSEGLLSRAAHGFHV